MFSALLSALVASDLTTRVLLLLSDTWSWTG